MSIRVLFHKVFIVLIHKVFLKFVLKIFVTHGEHTRFVQNPSDPFDSVAKVFFYLSPKVHQGITS